MNRKKFILITIVLSLVGVLIHGAYKYINGGVILGGTIFTSALILSYLINHITWGDPTVYQKKVRMKWDSKLHIKALKSRILYL
ncbi:hypothetical protein IIS_01932 [Bacillus cereus VD131]|nr:hypothetical protein IIS_01932 [Bacillus cereus VD131]